MRNLWARVVKGSTKLTPAEKLVWLEINFMSQRDEGCTLSARALAVRLGMNRSHVTTCRSFLLRMSLLYRIGDPGKAAAWYSTLDGEYTPTSRDAAPEVFKGFSERLDTYVTVFRSSNISDLI